MSSESPFRKQDEDAYRKVKELCAQIRACKDRAEVGEKFKDTEHYEIVIRLSDYFRLPEKV